MRTRIQRILIVWMLALAATVVLPTASMAQEDRLSFDEGPALPSELRGRYLGAQGGTLIAAGGVADDGELGGAIYTLAPGATEWTAAGELETARAWGAAASAGTGVILVGGETPDGPSADVVKLTVGETGDIALATLPSLPKPVARPAATVHGALLYAAGRFVGGSELWVGVLDLTNEAGAEWKEVPAPPVEVGEGLAFVSVRDRVLLFGSDGAASYLPRDGWRVLPAAPWWPADPSAAPFGVAHVFVPGKTAGGESGMLLYHAVTGTWVETLEAPWSYESPQAVRRLEEVVVVDADEVARVGVQPVEGGFGWLDTLMIAIYLGGMVAMGFYFVRRESSSADYFRGGNKLPWWAVGMSLFATGASAISLMSMPWKGFSEDLTYLGISFYSVLALPLSMLVLAPMVRKLAIVTPGHYMERRFGLGARLLAATIFCFTQIGARMGAVLLLPSIAISAVTGVPIWVCIVVMGFVTTAYTYMGGLGAVVWTDTVQGFVMVSAVLGCLILAWMRLDMPTADAWAALQAFDRTVMFDFRWDLTYPTAYLLFATTLVVTLMQFTDQNFVQRVQATANLRDTKIAVATQLGVAVPINILLFGLGLVLFLFYRERPEQLDPAMPTDGIFPFFVAQELPMGISGLVVAALMAATMSTISSSICATANVGMEDFFRRFRPQMTERGSVVLGRYLTAGVGLAGTLTALFLEQLEVSSIWDLAQMVINVIGNGIVGFFALGLLTRRAHQVGSTLGVVCGFGTILYLQNATNISFWAFSFIGTVVTFVTGYLFSIVIPATVKDTSGLTIYSLAESRPESEEAAERVGLAKRREVPTEKPGEKVEGRG